MISGTWVTIDTNKFPILEGEDEELVNEGMYGKALCQYLEKKLPSTGVEIPFFLCEDWGWWIEVKDKEFKMGLCIYSDPDAETSPEKYAISSSITNKKKWLWTKFKRIDVSESVLKVINSVETILKNDPEINNVTRHDSYPW